MINFFVCVFIAVGVNNVYYLLTSKLPKFKKIREILKKRGALYAFAVIFSLVFAWPLWAIFGYELGGK